MKAFLPFLLALFIQHLLPAQTDIKGSADHPFVSRYTGAIIVDYQVREFDQYDLALGPKTAEKTPADPLKTLEGKVTRIVYKNPKDAGVFAVIKSYEKALTGAGYTEMYRCSKENCGLWFSRHFQKGLETGVQELVKEDQEYRVYKGTKNGLPVYIAVYAMYNKYRLETYSRVEVVELTEMPADKVSAAQIGADIKDQGRSVVYDIFFDTNKADVKPESKPALEAIAETLKKDPTLKLYVVGHTDNVGGLDANIDLSMRRAQAVVSALVKDYAVAAGRLTPKGLGFLAPVAPNTAEAGRGRNRRVELVPQ
ncbi:MAG: OmpA family protein [Saprospiraceae bacterium]